MSLFVTSPFTNWIKLSELKTDIISRKENAMVRFDRKWLETLFSQIMLPKFV